MTAGGAWWRLMIFALVSGFVLVTILATIDPIGSGSATRTYRADFVSSSHLHPGEDVRVAGVKVGSVEAVSVTKDNLARVSFTVEDDLELTTASRVEIRYLDLAGSRYVAIVPGKQDASRQLPGRVITTDRTTPALDINDLLAGFKPLLVGLSPQAINDLSLEIVQTLQGDGDTVNHLIRRTASLTRGLADRDVLIGQVITNLDAAVGSLAQKHTQLEELVGGLRSLAEGLARDRRSIGLAIGHIDEMTALTADLISKSRPSLKEDIASLGGIARTLVSPFGHARIDHALDHLPDKLRRLTATASYGSWFNYYVCGVRVFVGASAQQVDPVLAALLMKIHLVDTAGRCAE